MHVLGNTQQLRSSAMNNETHTPTLPDLIADAKQTLQTRDAAVVKAEMRLDTLIRSRDKARAHLTQLVEVAKDAGLDVSTNGVDPIHEARTLKEAVRLALADHPNGAPSSKVIGYLAEHGRRDHPASVAAALSVAKQRGEVEGYWEGNTHFWRLP